MFQIIFQKFCCIYQQVKSTFISPRPFTSFSGLMRYQEVIFSRLLLRLNLSQGDLLQEQGLCLRPIKQPLVYAWTGSKWIAILTGFLAYFSLLPEYSRMLSVALGMEHYQTLGFANSLSFALGELLWWSQLSPLLGSPPRRNNGALGLLHAYGHLKVPSGLSPAEETRLLRAFNRQHTAMSRYCGFSLFANLLPLPSIIWRLLAFASKPDHAPFFQPFASLLLFLNISAQGLLFFTSCVYASSQAFLFRRLFKRKLAHALAWLTVAQTGKFTCAYLRLQGELARYNTFLSAFFFSLDLDLKLPGAFILVAFFDKFDLHQINPMIFAICLSCLIFYAAILGCFTAFAVFPQANLIAYKRLSGLYVQMRLGAKFREAWTKKPRPWAQRVRAQGPVDVRQALSINGLLQFLASRQFGFTYGRLFLIEKQNVFENVLATIFYFLLFIKRRV